MKKIKFVSSLLVTAMGAALVGFAHADPANESPAKWYADGERAVEFAKDLRINRHRAKNVILFVGDGMGVSTVTAARILEGQLRGESGEITSGRLVS